MIRRKWLSFGVAPSNCDGQATSDVEVIGYDQKYDLGSFSISARIASRSFDLGR
ncbi:hypothetical protein VCRA2110O3_40037 [Vibrio crassostreae]|nr:hypothetical protein VCRA2114E5_30037 [Vibrio crassostreae]CAK2852237.1 hypothetical protein VCRA2110O3_40037 [Vibrio crassostreae]CAK2994511.1 hypothetical protein VCRA2122O10_60037 [Vibrio crassostreae]CAK3061312.1 hypothetical protein VCRA2127O15_50197 [Vibrio crassostreae]CAK3564753.1 hypothetical protein VCRA2120O9_60036 [Vibrio crassostreae]